MAEHALPFSGGKIVLHHGGQLLTHLRDDLPTIPWPGYWDLPGGGREGAESPTACILRETYEEYGLSLPAARITFLREYPPLPPRRKPAWFAVAPITAKEIAAIRFGDEGQRWQLMAITEYLSHPLAIPHFQDHIRDWLAESPGAPG